MKILPSCGVSGLALGAIFLASGCSTATVKPVTTPPTDGPTSTGPICPTNPDDVISDFNLDNGVHQVDGRSGGWYTYGDMSGRGTLVPAQGAKVNPDLTVGNTDNCPGDLGSLHVKAMGFIDWGAAFGVDFVPAVPTDAGVMAKGTYDATKYKGVSFWAKASAPVRFVQVSFKDPYTDVPSILPDIVTQWCVFQGKMPNTCSPYLVKFGYGYETDANVAADYPAYARYKLDTTWKRFEVLFADTKQDRYNLGQKDPGDKLNLAQLTGMSIQANSDQSTVPPTANDWEIWIDDVTFIH